MRVFKLIISIVKGGELKIKTRISLGDPKYYERDYGYFTNKTFYIIKNYIIKWIKEHQEEITKEYSDESEYISTSNPIKIERDLISDLNRFIMSPISDKEFFKHHEEVSYGYRYEYKGFRIYIIPLDKRIEP